MISAVIERGAGMDVGKTFVVVCVMIARSSRSHEWKHAPSAQPMQIGNVYAHGWWRNNALMS
jgi:hypothetical protein